MNGLPRHAEFEKRMYEEFGVTDIRIYYAFSCAGDAWIVIRGNDVHYFETGSLYSDGIEPAMYRTVARRLGLLPQLS